MAYETILYEVADEIATITLNRPAKMNAYTSTMGAEITDAMIRADGDSDARVVILTGAGDRAFCAGADMAMFASDIKARETKADSRERRPPGISLPQLMRNLSKPTIAAINGYALGVGCTIPLLLDVRIASDNAKMGVIFPRVGLMSELGSSYLMPAAVPSGGMPRDGTRKPRGSVQGSRGDGARTRRRHAAMLADLARVHAPRPLPGTRRQPRDRDGVRGICARKMLHEPGAQGIRDRVYGEAKA